MNSDFRFCQDNLERPNINLDETIDILKFKELGKISKYSSQK